MRLKVTEWVDATRWRWLLEEADGRFLADHTVHLDPSSREYRGFCKLGEYLDYHQPVEPPEAQLRAPMLRASQALEGDDPALERAALAVQAGQDRERNFRLIFERFHRPVERFFSRRGLLPEDCLDLTQETFLRIHRGLESYRSEDRLSHWVLRIAATTFLQWVRAGRAAKRAGQTAPPEAADGEAVATGRSSRQLDALLDGEQRLALRRAVRELPDQMRNCLLLRLDQELSYPQIATLMRLSPETVKAHLFQARRRLKGKLGAAVGSALEGGPR